MASIIHRIITRKIPKLYLLDWIIIACLGLSVGGFLLLKLSRKTTWIPITVHVGSQDVTWTTNFEPWYAAALSPGMTAYDVFGQKNAQVQDVENFEVGGGKREIYLTLLVKATFDGKNKNYSFNLQPLTVGSGFKTNFGTQEIQGVVTFVGDESPYTEKTVTAKLLYAYPWVADSFRPGLKLTDTQGRTIAEILDVSSENAQLYEFTDLQGRIFAVSGTDATKKDVTMKLKLKTRVYNNTPYFGGKPVKIGYGIHLEFPGVAAQYMEITAVEN